MAAYYFARSWLTTFWMFGFLSTILCVSKVSVQHQRDHINI